MKVILINPLSEFVSKDIMPPLGLAWIAAVLEKNNVSVRIIDALAERKDLENVAHEVEGYRPDIVGITCVTHTRHEVFRTANIIKETCPDATIVIGGPHVTFTAEDSLRNVHSVDVIVRGEGEVTFLELLRALEAGTDLTKVKGISFRNRENIIHNPPRPFMEDLDSLPFPARHLLPMGKYDFKIPLTKVRATNVLGSRGCPMGCIYCSTSTMWGKRIRMRSPSNILDEIEQIVEEYGIKGIYFFDDTFTFHKRRTIEICDEIMRRGLDLTWFCESRVDVVDYELLTKMKEAGCKIISFGIESGSQRMLDTIKKKASVEQSINAINLCKKVGIKSKAFFMYSLPGELPQDIEATTRLALDLSPDISVSGMCDIRPGTELEDIAKEKNIIPDEFSWAKERSLPPKFRQKELPEEAIREIKRRVAVEYFLHRPVPLLKWVIKENIKLIPRLSELFSILISIIRGKY